MIHRGLRTAPFLAILLLMVCSAALAFPPNQGWVYEALERLKTLGIMPLWVGAVRPIPSAHLRVAVEEATQRAEGRKLSPHDAALLERLRRLAVPQTSLQFTTGPTHFAITRPSAVLATEASGSEWLFGSSTDTINSAGLYLQLHSFGLFLGRSPMGWGPGGDGALLFADSGPGVDRVQMFFNWRNARFTKVVGALDGGRSLVGTRLDIQVSPSIRVGFAESIVMAGSPYWGYILNPMPLLLSQYLEQQVRPPSGDNQLESADGEWVIRSGLRVFAEVVVDDFTVPTPTANYPHRLGFTLGFHRAFEAGSDLRAQYTLVSNWTYTQEPGDYVLRGVPLAHPLGNDFDVLHVRATRSLTSPIFWGSLIRKGEGRIGIGPSSDVEARQFWFLRGVIEYSFVAGTDFRFGDPEGWEGTAGPWIAYRTNAGHIQDVTRLDWGISLALGRTF
jgi:hypothetical protein